MVFVVITDTVDVFCFQIHLMMAQGGTSPSTTVPLLGGEKSYNDRFAGSSLQSRVRPRAREDMASSPIYAKSQSIAHDYEELPSSR